MSGMEPMLIMQLVGTGATILGGINSADQQRSAAEANARNAATAAAANKQQLDFTAGQERAAGQHAAEDARRKGQLALSRALAVSAASGGGPLSESLTRGLLMQTENNVSAINYGSEERARGLEFRGNVGAYEANAKGIQGIRDANASADATLMGTFGKAALTGMSALAPGAPPGVGSGWANQGFANGWSFDGM